MVLGFITEDYMGLVPGNCFQMDPSHWETQIYIYYPILLCIYVMTAIFLSLSPRDRAYFKEMVQNNISVDKLINT